MRRSAFSATDLRNVVAAVFREGCIVAKPGQVSRQPGPQHRTLRQQQGQPAQSGWAPASRLATEPPQGQPGSSAPVPYQNQTRHKRAGGRLQRPPTPKKRGSGVSTPVTIRISRNPNSEAAGPIDGPLAWSVTRWRIIV